MKRETFLPFGKPHFSEAEIAAVTEVLRQGWVGMGKESIAFEQELQAFCGAPHIVTVNSCTSALFLALKVLGVGPGDEVICPSLTWCATANAALYVGAKPVFCDVNSNTLCVTPESIAEKLTPRTKAVIPVHFGGLAIEVDEIRAVLPPSVAIVEDAAHALGTRFEDGSTVGSSGNLTCFSFYANKNLSTGDGGAIALFDEKLANRLCSLRQNAMPINAWKRFTHPESILRSEIDELGYKMNYTDLQACIGRVQLKRHLELQAKRLEIAQHYCEHLQTLEMPVSVQRDILHPNHARHLFVIKLGETKPFRDDLLLALRARNIGASIHYAPLHRMPLYNGHQQPILPNTEDVCSRILTLPISASMSVEDADYVMCHMKELMKS